MSNSLENKSFWEHLDDLRSVIIRCLVVVVVATCVCFCLKDTLFGVLMAPASPAFFLYDALGVVSSFVVGAEVEVEPVHVSLINTELAGQLMMHFKMAFFAAVVVSAPVLLWLVAHFVSPALYAHERRLMRWILLGGTLFFYLGVTVAYVLVFPLAFRFLAAYTVDDSVQNMISLTSYIDNFLVLHLLMGLLFELPMVAIGLARAGFVNAKLMSHYRRHAILAILILAAVVTPTTDVFTLLLVGLPVYLLYELSIVIVRRVV